MKRFLVFLLVAAALFAYTSCDSYNYDREYYVETPRPENGIFAAPTVFNSEWDIPSVRDDSVAKDGYYSMPVYRIDTYGELLHLKMDIVDMYFIGNEVENDDFCAKCQTSKICAHKQYNLEFFENYSLLIGWCQYKGLILPEHVETANGDTKAVKADWSVTTNGDLLVSLIGEYADSELVDEQQWVLVAVPKYKIASCNKITFLVKLPTKSDSDATTDETTDETIDETTDETTDEIIDETLGETTDETSNQGTVEQ